MAFIHRAFSQVLWRWYPFFTAEKILKTEPPEAMMTFNYFKGLRNKHLVHADFIAKSNGA